MFRNINNCKHWIEFYRYVWLYGANAERFFSTDTLSVVEMTFIFVDFIDMKTPANHSQTEKSPMGFMFSV